MVIPICFSSIGSPFLIVFFKKIDIYGLEEFMIFRIGGKFGTSVKSLKMKPLQRNKMATKDVHRICNFYPFVNDPLFLLPLPPKPFPEPLIHFFPK